VVKLVHMWHQEAKKWKKSQPRMVVQPRVAKHGPDWPHVVVRPRVAVTFLLFLLFEATRGCQNQEGTKEQGKTRKVGHVWLQEENLDQKT
jgi:hypothetical protein